jgi:hypothetical protein
MPCEISIAIVAAGFGLLGVVLGRYFMVHSQKHERRDRLNSDQLDRYARDGDRWNRSALFNYRAATTLFETEDMVLVFPAATLAHHAIEMYLKAALICEGLTVFNPDRIEWLDPSIGLKRKDCAWNYSLVKLGRQLAAKRHDFDLSRVILGYYLPQDSQMTLEKGLDMFDPFFDELRYPRELKALKAVGPSDIIVLKAIVAALEPFLPK